MSYITCTIALDSIIHNYHILQKYTPLHIGAVVKANAYGHGMPAVARALQEVGCSFFFTGSIQEAVSLRASGNTGNILPLLGFTTHEEIDLCIQNSLIPLLHTKEQISLLRNFKKPIAIKFDTGMGRLGFCTEEISWVLAECKKYSLDIAYLLSHISTAPDPLYTALQKERFNTVYSEVQKQYPRVQASLGSSGTIGRCTTFSCDIIRSGLALYGYDDCIQGLQPAMTLSTKILQIRNVHKGNALSYGKTYIAKKDMKIAVLAIGYADGYHRYAKNAFVLIEGQQAPLIGTICMQAVLADITHIENVSLNTNAYIVDPSQSLTATEVASFWNTIPYEVLCSLGKKTSSY